MRRMGPICAVMAMYACAPSTSEDATGRRPGWLDPQPASGEVPVGVPGIAFSGGGGGYSWEGALAPGSGSFTDAPSWDWETSEEPSAFGGGAYDVTVDGVRHASSAAESFSAIVDDGAGGDYLVLGAVVFEADRASVLYVVTPRADFAPGAGVAIDGSERLALFATGSVDAEGPDLVAAAASGTITFGAGTLDPGGAVSASVTGEFGRIAWDDAPPDDPSDPPATVAAGTYHLAIGGAVEVQCDGTMAGQEASYAALTPADAGFVDGDVTVSGALTIDGASLASAFGASSLALDWDGGAWQTVVETLALDWDGGAWQTVVETPGPGPLGTDRAFSMLAILPGVRLTAMLATVYGGESGWCAVQWAAALD
jgi:hypothetical protein